MEFISICFLLKMNHERGEKITGQCFSIKLKDTCKNSGTHLGKFSTSLFNLSCLTHKFGLVQCNPQINHFPEKYKLDTLLILI